MRGRGVTLAGIGFDLSASDPRLPLGDLFGWVLRTRRSPQHTWSIALSLAPSGRAVCDRPEAPWTPIFFHGRTRVFTHERRYRFWDGTSQFDVDPAARRITGEVHPHSLHDAHTFTHATMLILVAVCLRLEQRFHLHGGLVELPGTGPVLIAGDAGRGKSTTTLSLLTQGGRFVGDDALYLMPTSHRVFGFPKPLHVSERTARAFPFLLPLWSDAREADTGKRAIPPRKALPGRLRASLPWPRALLLPVVADRDVTTCEAIGPGDALGELLGASALVAVDGLPFSAEHLSALRDVADAAPARLVLLGRDALSDPTLVPARFAASLRRG
jgi:hypothetical protein